ncbi:TPA: hypothetical protein HA363_02245 [Candidatus Woesearchaeota archaeon]|nr:hypothetical protein [Candidatus Woesearchaeota archaeon]
MNYRKLALAFLILAIGISANFIMSDVLENINRGFAVWDLMHFLFPLRQFYSLISETFLVIAVMIFLFYVCRYRKYDYVPYYLIMIGAFYFIRAVLLPLTPIPSPYNYDYGFLYALLPQHGTFPSGHAGMVFLFFFMTGDKVLRYALLMFAIATVFFLIISRGHYTIDVIGSIMITYIMANVYKMRDYADARITTKLLKKV